MMNQGLSGTGRRDGRRRFVRIRGAAEECGHRALVGVGDHAGRCLECGTCVRTPFTIGGSGWGQAA
jgi:hypothetical protein